MATRGFLPVWQVLTALAHEDTALYDALARARADVDTGTDPADALVGVENLDLDLSAFPHDAAATIGLRVLRSTTSTWATLAARLRDHVHAGGDVAPRRGYCLPDGYPLGRRVADAHSAYRDGRLHPAVQRLFTQQVPGWDWQPAPDTRPRLRFEDYIALLSAHVTKTGVPAVRPYEATTTPDGHRVAIGAWLDRQRHRSLTPEQRQQIVDILGPRW